MYVCVHVHARAHTHRYIYTHTYICIYIHTHTYIYIHMYTHTHTRVLPYILNYMWILLCPFTYGNIFAGAKLEGLSNIYKYCQPWISKPLGGFSSGGYHQPRQTAKVCRLQGAFAKEAADLVPRIWMGSTSIMCIAPSGNKLVADLRDITDTLLPVMACYNWLLS